MTIVNYKGIEIQCSNMRFSNSTLIVAPELMINNKGHIIKLHENKNNEICILSMNIILERFFDPTIKLDIIVCIYDLFKKNETQYITNDKGLTLLQGDIVSYCKSNLFTTEIFATDFFFAYYLLYKDWVTHHFVNIEDVTDDYVNDNKVMIWDELFTRKVINHEIKLN